MLHEKIKEEIKEAMRAKESIRLEVLRGVLAAFINELVSTGKKPQDTIDDDAALIVIKRLAKQRKDSIEQFEKGKRKDLADKEREELTHLEKYLPKMMSKSEIKKIAEAKKVELGIEDKAKMGILMGAVMKELKDKAYGADVKEVLENLF
jgi:uncharacterized protein YqeY